MKSAIQFKNREQARTDGDRRLNDRREHQSPFGGFLNALRPLIG